MSQSSFNLDSEWSILKISCSGVLPGNLCAQLRSLLNRPVNWNRLVALADQHGLQSLLYQTLSSVPDLVPESQMRALQQIYQANLHKSLFLSRELIRVVDHLSSMAIDVLPYKGPALAEMYYGDLALRSSGDIDLLVLQKDLGRIREAVKALGYVPHWCFSPHEESSFLTSGYECAFDGPAGPNLLEIQWALQPKFYSVDFDMQGLFSRAKTTRVAGYLLKTPSAEDQVIVLSLHAAKHAWSRLIWLCDVARIMHANDLDWDWICSEAAELGMCRILRVGAILAERLIGAPIPPAVDNNIPHDVSADKLAEEIETRICANSGHNPESLEYFRLMLRLRERLRDRIRFISRLVFTPGPGEWSRVHLPPALSPLYRIVRLGRIATRIVRGRREQLVN